MSAHQNESQEVDFFRFIGRFESVVESVTKASDAIRERLTQGQLETSPIKKQEERMNSTHSNVLIPCHENTSQRATRLLLSKDPQRHQPTYEMKVQDNCPETKPQTRKEDSTANTYTPLTTISSKDLAMRLMWEHARIEQELKQIRNTSQRLVHEELKRSLMTPSEYPNPPRHPCDTAQAISDDVHMEHPDNSNVLNSGRNLLSPSMPNNALPPRRMFTTRFSSPESVSSVLSPASMSSRTSPQNPVTSQSSSPDNNNNNDNGLQNTNPGTVDNDNGDDVEPNPPFSLGITDDAEDAIVPEWRQDRHNNAPRRAVDIAFQTSPQPIQTRGISDHTEPNTWSTSSSPDTSPSPPSSEEDHPPVTHSITSTEDDDEPLSSLSSPCHAMSQLLSFDDDSGVSSPAAVDNEREDDSDTSSVTTESTLTPREPVVYSPTRPLDASFLSDLGDMDVDKPLSVPDVPASLVPKLTTSPHRIRRCAQILWSRGRRNSSVSYTSSSTEDEPDEIVNKEEESTMEEANQEELEMNTVDTDARVTRKGDTYSQEEGQDEEEEQVSVSSVGTSDIQQLVNDSFEYALHHGGPMHAEQENEKELVHKLPDVHPSYWPLPKLEERAHIPIEGGMHSLNITLPDLDEDFHKAVQKQLEKETLLEDTTLSLSNSDAAIDIDCRASSDTNVHESISTVSLLEQEDENKSVVSRISNPTSENTPDAWLQEKEELDESKEMTALVQILRNVPTNLTRTTRHSPDRHRKTTYPKERTLPNASVTHFFAKEDDPEVLAMEEALLLSQLLNGMPPSTRTSMAPNVLPEQPLSPSAHSVPTPFNVSTHTTLLDKSSSSHTSYGSHTHPIHHLRSTSPCTSRDPSRSHHHVHGSAIYTDSWIRSDNTPGNVTLAYDPVRTVQSQHTSPFIPAVSIPATPGKTLGRGASPFKPKESMSLREQDWVTLPSYSCRDNAPMTTHSSESNAARHPLHSHYDEAIDCTNESTLSAQDQSISYDSFEEIQKPVAPVVIPRPPWKPSGKVPTEFAK